MEKFASLLEKLHNGSAFSSASHTDSYSVLSGNYCTICFITHEIKTLFALFLYSFCCNSIHSRQRWVNIFILAVFGIVCWEVQFQDRTKLWLILICSRNGRSLYVVVEGLKNYEAFSCHCIKIRFYLLARKAVKQENRVVQLFIILVSILYCQQEQSNLISGYLIKRFISYRQSNYELALAAKDNHLFNTEGKHPCTYSLFHALHNVTFSDTSCVVFPCIPVIEGWWQGWD